MVWVIIGSIVLGLVVLDLIALGLIIRVVVPWFEKGPPFNVEASPLDPRAEQIEISTPDGLTLRGGYYHHLDRTPRGVIVFCHEFTGSHWSAMSYCQGLWDAGFDLLAFDFRNHGESDFQPGFEPLHWLTECEITDALAAIEYAAERPELAGLPIGIYGVSRGGGAALVAAARNAAVEAVTSDGGYGTNVLMQHHTPRWATLVVPAWLYRMIPWWHTLLSLTLIRFWSQRRRGVQYANVERWLPRLRSRDVLLISGGRDNYVMPEVTWKLRELIGGLCSEPWIVPQAKHNCARSMNPTEYDQRLVAFFSGMPGAEEVVREIVNFEEPAPAIVD